MNSGTPKELIGIYNQASFRNTGSGTINLLSGSENHVSVEDFGGTGIISNTIGVRGKVLHDNPNITSTDIRNGFFELQLKSGIVNGWAGVTIDLNQSGGTIESGSYLLIESGVQLPNVNMKAINSRVDLPSYFKGSIESDITIAKIDTANGKILPTKEWVQANSATKFSSNVGNGTMTTINVSHNLGTEDVIIQVRDVNTKIIVECTKTVIDSNTISLTFDTAPSQNAKRVVVIA